MNKKTYLKFILIIFLFFSCSKEIEKKSVILEKSVDLQVLEAYKEGKGIFRSW